MKHDPLEALFEAWSESRLTSSEAAELSALLRADAKTRARFQEAAAFHGQLHAAINALSLEQALSPVRTATFPPRSRALGMAAALLFVGLTAMSLGWLLASPEEIPRMRHIGIQDGQFEQRRGATPTGFPRASFTWGGDPSEFTTTPDSAHPHALRFQAAAGEPNVPNSPQQSCDIFQIIDLKSCQAELLSSREAFVELTASFLDTRTQQGAPIRFMCKVYVFEGAPTDVAESWPPAADQTIGSGAQFYVSKPRANSDWKTVSTRCVLPPSAGFLVVQISAGSAERFDQHSPQLGEQFATDIRLMLHTRPSHAKTTAR